MANIYETSTLNKRGQELYEASQNYDKNDVVKVVTEWVNSGGTVTTATTNTQPDKNVQKTFYYYYARKDVTSGGHGSDLAPTISDNAWGGIVQIEGAKIPEFIWKPSYASSVTHEPSVNAVSFGDGYEQRVSQMINSDLITLNVNFDKRRKKEATAILHFLNTRKSAESFLFSPPEPYNPSKQRFFVCRSWSNNFNFFDNFTIQARFEEVAA